MYNSIVIFILIAINFLVIVLLLFVILTYFVSNIMAFTLVIKCCIDIL